MDLSAVIFVLLAVAWAVYLIPRALRHHDEAARTRSIDTFSGSTRVLARSEPADDRDTRLVISADRPVGAAPVSPSVESNGTSPVAPAAGSLAAARAAVRRRRRILAFLLLCVVATTVAAALGYLPRWSVAVPGGLTLAYLALCRTQVRRVSRGAPRRDRSASPAVAAEVAPASAPAQERACGSGASATPDVPHTAAAPAAQVAQVVEEPSDVPFDAKLHVEPSGPADAGTGTIWDPLPVTLPTYVTAPKAHRTVRTIDLGEPGTWTSGRTAEDAELAVQAAQPEASDDPDRRAVGS